MTDVCLNSPIKKDDVLSCWKTGRQIELGDVVTEFMLMKNFLKNPLTAEITSQICQGSGTHLLKMINPRFKAEQIYLYIDDPDSSKRPDIRPSSNAADSPFCKVLYRPLEITGHPARSVIDNIMNPDDISQSVLDDFASVFGQDVLDAACKALDDKVNEPKNCVANLATREFPIIFIPYIDDRDIQITPVSPATSSVNVLDAINALHERKKEIDRKLPSGFFDYQIISAQPQNISPMINKKRHRLIAKMPEMMGDTEAEIYRYAKGGSFPHLKNSLIAKNILHYANMLERNEIYNNLDTRTALNKTADCIIGNACDFINEILQEVKTYPYPVDNDMDIPERQEPPSPANVLLRRKWSDTDFNIARKALTSLHFKARMKRFERAEKRVAT